MKKALITGITGQDGAYLAQFLIGKGYEVYGMYRRSSSPNFWRVLSLGIKRYIKLIPGDMTDMASIANAIIKSNPDEIYNLAAQSFVGTSFEQPLLTTAVDGTGVVMLLEAVKQHNPKIKIYHASSSELYGNCMDMNGNPENGLTEEDIFYPASPYAAAKLYSYHTIKIYREAYGMFAVNGILFNHESPLRGLEFVTRKITNGLARIKVGLQDKLILGNLDAERDWGYASEYVEAMWLMLQNDKADDFVIANTRKHSVKNFVELACKHLGLDIAKVVVSDKKYMRPLDVNCLIGDSSKAKKILKWEPKVKFEELVKIMVDKDLERWEDHLKGKIFPWDAINDPEAY
jgi:GDPmannose 4,6-dehydratase